jgi:hypothetical protein
MARSSVMVRLDRTIGSNTMYIMLWQMVRSGRTMTGGRPRVTLSAVRYYSTVTDFAKFLG